MRGVLRPEGRVFRDLAVEEAGALGVGMPDVTSPETIPLEESETRDRFSGPFGGDVAEALELPLEVVDASVELLEVDGGRRRAGASRGLGLRRTTLEALDRREDAFRLEGTDGAVGDEVLQVGEGVHRNLRGAVLRGEVSARRHGCYWRSTSRQTVNMPGDWM